MIVDKLSLKRFAEDGSLLFGRRAGHDGAKCECQSLVSGRAFAQATFRHALFGVVLGRLAEGKEGEGEGEASLAPTDVWP